MRSAGDYLISSSEEGLLEKARVDSISGTLEQPIPGDADRCSTTYELKSIVYHKGAAWSRGHYTAAVRDGNGNWTACDDAVVRSTSANEVSCPSGDIYLLFYERQGG